METKYEKMAINWRKNGETKMATKWTKQNDDKNGNKMAIKMAIKW